MENLNGLLSAAFLILIAAAAAVTGSMVVLGLFDRLFSKKKSPPPDPKSPGDGEQEISELQMELGSSSLVLLRLNVGQCLLHELQSPHPRFTGAGFVSFILLLDDSS
jgi:hypothetical protein